MNKVYAFLTTAGLNDIMSMKAIVERITYQTVQCSYFIQAYCANQKFRKPDLAMTLILTIYRFLSRNEAAQERVLLQGQDARAGL